MNKQIEALAKVVGYNEITKAAMRALGFDIEKFAELIILECAELTLDHPNPDYYQGWLDYRDEIRQHWGIEP